MKVGSIIALLAAASIRPSAALRGAPSASLAVVDAAAAAAAAANVPRKLAGCYPAYSSGTDYTVGSVVSSSVTTTTPITYVQCFPPGEGDCPDSGQKQLGGETSTSSKNYVCKSNDWCPAEGYAPGGTYSDLAWTEEGECTVSFYVLFCAHLVSIASHLNPSF